MPCAVACARSITAVVVLFDWEDPAATALVAAHDEGTDSELSAGEEDEEGERWLQGLHLTSA